MLTTWLFLLTRGIETALEMTFTVVHKRRNVGIIQHSDIAILVQSYCTGFLKLRGARVFLVSKLAVKFPVVGTVAFFCVCQKLKKHCNYKGFFF